MTRYTVTPWRTEADLLQVREQLYPSGIDRKDVNRYAVGCIMAWKLRGNLPHAVESTALLVDAILHHDPHVNSAFSIRAVYSAAFCRFVTGFCDIGRHRERALEPSSMLEIARQIGMPAAFVALRHEAIHEELPGLQRLMDATQKALDWLWRVYWSRLDEVEEAMAIDEGQPTLRSEVAAVLRDYRKVVRSALLAKKQTSEVQMRHAEEACETLSTVCHDTPRLMATLAEVLLADGFLTPTNRASGSSLTGSYLLWDGLVDRIRYRIDSNFVYELGVALLQHVISKSPTRKPEEDTEQEALAHWLLHLLEPNGDDSAREHLAEEVMKRCCLYPSYWRTKVAKELLNISQDDFLEDWRDLFEASQDVKTAVEHESGLGDGQADIGGDYEVGEEDEEDHPKMADVQEDFDGEKDSEGRVNTWTRAILSPLAPIGTAR